MKHMRQSGTLPLTLWLCLLLCSALLVPDLLRAQEAKAEKKEEKKVEEAPQPAVKHPPLGRLWSEAQELLKVGDTGRAALAFYRVHYYYPEDTKGESALWLAAHLELDLARIARAPDWDKVLDRFRRYIDYYPKSPRAAAAYFELGKTYQAMRFYREAQAYFKLFLERYPDSPLVPQAMRWYRNALLRTGHGDKADGVFTAWRQAADPTVRLLGEMGTGIMKSMRGDYQGGLAVYQRILTSAPDYPIIDPEILRYAGVANLRTGQTEIGREQLYHYLSLTGDSAERPEILVELGESYFKAGEYQTAAKLYRRASREGGENERAVLISNFRQAQLLDDPDVTLAKWQRHNDLQDRAGDRPYLAVLEKLYREPLAQDARFGMFRRYQARGQLDKAYELGRNFLRNAEPVEAATPEGKEVGRILLYLVEELLHKKRYQEICDLYNDEYRHIKGFPSAKLHAMVGQALEALSLYGPAAELYYVALKWPMTDQEKTDLYFRRARIYLAAKDYEAEDRLLAYLQKFYKGKPESGEVAYYGAKLSEARGKFNQAHDLYGQALNQSATPELRGRIVQDALGLMIREARLDPAEALLTRAVTGKWLAPAATQGWWLAIGNGWRGKGDSARAKAAYEKGLAQGLPAKGDPVQQLHLYLGDLLMAQGNQEEGLSHYQAAGQGDNQLWKRMATERQTQQALEAEMAAAMKKGAGQ